MSVFIKPNSFHDKANNFIIFYNKPLLFSFIVWSSSSSSSSSHTGDSVASPQSIDLLAFRLSDRPPSEGEDNLFCFSDSRRDRLLVGVAEKSTKFEQKYNYKLIIVFSFLTISKTKIKKSTFPCKSRKWNQTKLMMKTTYFYLFLIYVNFYFVLRSPRRS